MTPKEAIDWCEQFIDNLVSANVDTKKRTLGLQAMQTCKSALEKQIPKKPVNVSKFMQGNCPICNGRLVKVNFCQRCGQALSWGNEGKAK